MNNGHPLTLSIFKESESRRSVLPIESYPLNFTTTRDDPQRLSYTYAFWGSLIIVSRLLVGVGDHLIRNIYFLWLKLIF